METTQRSPIDYIINGLKNAASELEDLQVQIALGKTEAKDIFESMKKSMHSRIQQIKIRMSIAKTNKEMLPIVNALEHLQVQLALGFAETKDAFDTQRRKIEHSLFELENNLKSITPGRQMAKIQLEIEKFKAKLQLLSLHYKLNKINREFDLQQKKEDFEKQLIRLRTALELKEGQVNNKWHHFKNDVTEAFDNLKSAFLPLD